MELYWDYVLPKIGFGALSRRTRTERLRKIARSFRELAAQLGGVLIKVGQFLSSRLDVLPREITSELTDLQDEVDPETFEAIKDVIEAEFGRPLADIFESFEVVPLASASIGQVYRAWLHDTASDASKQDMVVVKVQRPHIEDIIEADLAAIRVAAGWLQRLQSVRKHANVPALVDEFSRTLYEEIDYLHEGKNAELFGKNFRDRPEVVVPSVIWQYTTRRVLTLQDVSAIKITDYPAIEAAGIDRAVVANRLFEVYLKQVFEDGFFHADPHPGNLFILPVEGSGVQGNWKLVFVDFGMAGSIAPGTFTALREALLAIGTRDAVRLVGAFNELHMLLPEADTDLLVRVCSKLLDSLWGKSNYDILHLDDHQIKAIVSEFRELLYEKPFQIPQDLMLLGRCIGILSGLAMGLNPDFNVWHGLSPYVGRLMNKSGESKGRVFLGEAAAAIRLLVGLPKRADDLVAILQEGKLVVRTPELIQHLATLENGIRKLAGCIVFAAGMVASTELYLSGHITASALLGSVEVVLLLWILLFK